MADDIEEASLRNAFNYVTDNGQAIRKAARMFNVPESTLRTRINNPSSFDSKMGRPGIFSRNEEIQLANHCKSMAKIGYGYCRWQIMEMAESLVQLKGGSSTPSKRWYYGFVKRFKDLSIQKPKKREISRVIATSKEDIAQYYIELEKILDMLSVKNKPEHIWNVDETGIQVDQTPPKVVAAKGERPFVVTSGRSANTTVIAAGSALGETIPPYIIYKGQRLTDNLTSGCIPETKFTTTLSGWSTSETFLDFLDYQFIPHIQTRPILLLYDGHSTHITTDVIKKAKDNDIHLFVLPPHSSHFLQPLDVGVFSPFKAALSSESHKLMHSQIGRKIIREDLPSLIARSYESAFTVKNLMSAFRKTGIFPFNPEINTGNSYETPQVGKQKSRKARVDMRNIKVLLSNKENEANSNLKQQQQQVKCRKSIIPPHGTAITQDEFINKLQERKNPTDAQEIKKPKPPKRRLFSDITNEQSKKKKKTAEIKTTKNKTTEHDSQIAGPSNIKGTWVTFYNSSDVSDDEEEVCCICHLFSPVGFMAHGGVELLNWGKCDTCHGWVHLKYCSSVKVLGQAEPFKCSKCS